MPEVKNEGVGGRYLSIFNGRFVERVPEGTVGATSRVNKIGATVWEVTREAWRGIVKGWTVETSPEYGSSLKVYFDDITISLSGKMMNEFIKKFAAADPAKEITVSPYPDFVGKDGTPRKSGLTLIQNGERLYSHFSDYQNGEFTLKNGFPAPPAPWDDMTDSQKKIYNIQTDEFLKNWVMLHPLNEIGSSSEHRPKGDDDTINIDDVPFN